MTEKGRGRTLLGHVHVMSCYIGGGWKETYDPERSMNRPLRYQHPIVGSVGQLKQALVNPRPCILGKWERKWPLCMITCSSFCKM